ncbi:MAG: hypothetical protein K2J29_10285 [Muribaculaceae bacterium]|nr:hypothetical protein [Muribaculaceae bacterium]
MKKETLCREIAPHVLHLAMSTAILVLTCKILHRVCHMRNGFEKIEEGRKAIKDGEKEMFN